MTKPFNPLMDRRRRSAGEIEQKHVSSIEMNATDSDELTGSAPMSPVSGRPMVKAFCRDVPVWVDPSARLVLPVKI